ncbi:hypothetical protein [Jeotgalicoccus sp. WY2]|nr:hypothetical protein [Jeotgalicoccus sp. WY2]
MIIGNKEEILSKLDELSKLNLIDEFMFHIPSTDAEVRNQTVKILAPIHTIHKEKAGIL